jgi:predicted outer membrane protein
MLRTSLFSWATVAAVALTGLLVAPAPARAAEKFSKDDKEMVDSALANLRMGMESGRLAKDRANHQVVKGYASDVIGTDQKLFNELKDLAKAHNYNADDDLSKKDAQMKSQLKDLEGQHFDLKFLKMSMHEHQQLIATFRKGGDNAKSDDLKKFFSDNERAVRDNLDRAKELSEKLASDDSDNAKDKKR